MLQAELRTAHRTTQMSNTTISTIGRSSDSHTRTHTKRNIRTNKVGRSD
jgi:hypothetical protein